MISPTADALLDVLRGIVSARNTGDADTAVRQFLSHWPAIVHLSLWGSDHEQRRAFFVRDFPTHPSITERPPCMTLPYGNGALGRCAQQNEDQFLSEGDLPSLAESDALRDLLRKHGIRSGACISLPSPPDYPSSAVVLLTEPDHALIADVLPSLKTLLGSYLMAYANDEARRYEGLVQAIARSKVTSHGIDFLRNACGAFASAFSATTFSVWLVEGQDVVPKYFSKDHPGGNYRLGQGLTGHVAASGKPIFLHVLTDAPRVYDVEWAGLVSDYDTGPPNENDHIIIVPLIYPKASALGPSVNGVLRFIGAAAQPSFWPVDFARAKAVAGILSVLLYQEALLRDEEANSMTLNNLLTLVYQANAADSVSFIVETFLKEMRSWPGVRKVSILDRSPDGTYPLDECTFLGDHARQSASKLLAMGPGHSIEIGDRIRIWLVRDQADHFAALLSEIDRTQNPHCATWLQLASQIIGNYYSIDKLLQERQKLIRDNEEREMAALAGAVSRIYAHEMVNGCKDLKAWAVRAQKTGPNYNAMLARVQEMFDHVNELLNATGFLKLTKTSCILNAQLEHFLGRLGLKHGTKRDGCEIRLDIAGHKHRRIFIDPNTLLGIIQNLVINAQEQYTLNGRTGPIEIRIVEQELPGRLHAGFAVTDYAVGIPPDLLDRIWDYGYTTKHQQGKGLGLAIVKRLVEECDGKVSVASTYGHITTFTVLYPVEHDEGNGGK